MIVVGYPTPGKEKAHVLLQAFLPAGIGRVASRIPDRLDAGGAAFYGVTPATKHLWQQARAEGRDWYYIDNAYFDPCRELYFRVTRNALQRDGAAPSDGARLTALGLTFKPWRAAGKHILVCPQSDEFMKTVARHPGEWLDETVRELRTLTGREVRVRAWNRNKKAWYASLPDDLKGCHAVVTYSSASAISAMMAGVPAICTGADCVAGPATVRDLSRIESPVMSEGDRLKIMRAAADGQWTVKEMRAGVAWRAVGR